MKSQLKGPQKSSASTYHRNCTFHMVALHIGIKFIIERVMEYYAVYREVSKLSDFVWIDT